MKILLVAFGGSLGALARYGLSGAIYRAWPTAFPIGTLLVNVLGCFAAGVVFAFVEDHQTLSPNLRAFIAVGVLGAFTTFSTFGYETLDLLRKQAFGLAFASVAANVAIGLGAVWLGRAMFLKSS